MVAGNRGREAIARDGSSDAQTSLNDVEPSPVGSPGSPAAKSEQLRALAVMAYRRQLLGGGWGEVEASR